MRANILYSVDFEDVPSEVEKLLSDVEQRNNNFSDLCKNITSLLQANSLDAAIEGIKEFRKELFKVDQRLSDCQAVLEGYLAAKYQQEKPTSEEE